MKVKKLILCFALLLPLCSCQKTNLDSSSSSEKTYKSHYVVNYELDGAVSLSFKTKQLNFFKISNFPFNLDFEKFGIDFDELIIGDTVWIETNRMYFMPLSDLRYKDIDFSKQLEVLNITVSKAKVVPLKILKKDNNIQLIDENNSSINYHLINYLYEVSIDDIGIKQVHCAFNSFNYGNDYTLLSDLNDQDIVYGTYVEDMLTSTECPLYAIYAFNPLV